MNNENVIFSSTTDRSGLGRGKLVAICLVGVLGLADGAAQKIGEIDDTEGDAARHIAAYHGYSNRERLWVKGRLLANAPPTVPEEDDSWWDNLAASYNRWESDELPGRLVRLEYAGVVKSVETDEEGYYKAEFAVVGDPLGGHIVTVTHAAGDRTLETSQPITVLDEQAEFIVISDMDDTVIHTGLTDLVQTAKRTILDNARTREPLAGVGPLYRAFARSSGDRPINPMVYLSDSTWNLYDLLSDFLALNDLPAGPLLLRDIGVGSKTSNHKTESLRRLLERFEPLPVVLIGDSGQHDAEVYSRIAEENPQRIKAIYIRDIDPHEASEHDDDVDQIIERSKALGLPFLRVSNSVEIARHAISIGLFPPSHLAGIDGAIEADKF